MRGLDVVVVVDLVIQRSMDNDHGLFLDSPVER